MKIHFILAAVIFCAVFFTTTGCSEDYTSEAVSLANDNVSLSERASNRPVRRAYKDMHDTWYNFVPDTDGGWDPMHPAPFPAWYPGGGEGNATHMGNVNTFFNQYVTFIPPNIVSLHAPVTMFFSAELAAAGYTDIPDEVGSIVYDDKGNSIWFHAISNTATPVAPDRVEFSGVNQIIGGTGKFEGATGEVSLNGYFNPQDQQDAAYWQEGWIEY
jgi:hypothetical protein